MKKCSLVLWSFSCLIFFFSNYILAQGGAPNTGKAPIVHQNPKVTWNHTPKLMPLSNTGYGWEAFSSNFISFPLPDGNPWTTISAWNPPSGYTVFI